MPYHPPSSTAKPTIKLHLRLGDGEGPGKHNDSGRIRDDLRNDFFGCDCLGRFHDRCHTYFAGPESRFDETVHGDDYASERPSTVNLSVRGLPSGTSGTFNPSSVTSSHGHNFHAEGYPQFERDQRPNHDVYGARKQR